jgi:tetratricopeptide (TPR) repeat protein
MSLLAEATSSYRKGDFAGAIAKYQQLLLEKPQSPDGYAGLVHAYLKAAEVEQAERAAEKGMLQANSPRVRAARAEVWFRQGRITDAEQEWVTIVNSGYPEPRAYLGLARVRRSIAMYKTAKMMLEKAHELDPDDPDIEMEWVLILPRAERMKYLQDALAEQDRWSGKERETIQNYLEALENRARENRGPCRLAGKITATETPLHDLLTDPRHLRGYGLPVMLNGHKSSLLLDTGAHGIVVKRRIAEQAGISKIIATKIYGVGDQGRRDAFVGVADSIKIGDLEFQNCTVEVVESRSVAGEDGLIGGDVFQHFLVELDFPHEKLKLSQLPQRPGAIEPALTLKNGDDSSDDSRDSSAADRAPDAGTVSAARKGVALAPASGEPQDRYIAPEMQSYTRVFRFGHNLLISTSVDQIPGKLFLMDTGALMNVISPEAAREVTKLNHSEMRVKGISGGVGRVFSADKATLIFGHLRQENQDMTAFETKSISEGIGTEVSGFLGFTTLRFLDIKIDYRDALVDFEYTRAR